MNISGHRGFLVELPDGSLAGQPAPELIMINCYVDVRYVQIDGLASLQQRVSVTFYDGADDPANPAAGEIRRLTDEVMALPTAERAGWLAQLTCGQPERLPGSAEIKRSQHLPNRYHHPTNEHQQAQCHEKHPEGA
jgi:hypothetical protein